MSRTGLALVLLAYMSVPAFTQARGAHDTGADAQNRHGIVIFGDGFVFLVSEPDGWDTDTGQQAKEYSVNAIFFPRSEASRSHHVNIRVRLNRKTTEDPDEDMTGDLKGYKKRYPSAKFAKLSEKHAQYKTSAGLFYTENDFYDYVAYLNPGAQCRFMFSVALSKEKRPATPGELAAFTHVLRSLHFVTDDVQGARPQQ